PPRPDLLAVPADGADLDAGSGGARRGGRMASGEGGGPGHGDPVAAGFLDSRLRRRLSADLRLRAAPRLAAGPGLFAAVGRTLALVQEPDPADHGAGPRLSGACRPDRAVHH